MKGCIVVSFLPQGHLLMHTKPTSLGTTREKRRNVADSEQGNIKTNFALLCWYWQVENQTGFNKDISPCLVGLTAGMQRAGLWRIRYHCGISTALCPSHSVTPVALSTLQKGCR